MSVSDSPLDAASPVDARIIGSRRRGRSAFFNDPAIEILSSNT
jgi:hypothetical protein